MDLQAYQITPYIPFRLNVLSGDAKEIYELSGIAMRDGWINYERRIEIQGENSPRYYTQELKYCKPILRPLSFLKTEIEINGKIILPIDILGYETDSWQTRFLIIETETRKFKDVQKLFEWHFDVFGLIEKGLAVDYMSVFNKP